MNSPIIKITNLSFRYNNSEDYALSDINLEINEGEFICISGSSGSGKSTLALALCGFIPHIIEGEFTGQIFLEDFSTKDLLISEISQFIGLVQQDPENQLVTSNPFEEISFGPENLCLSKEEIYKRINKCISVLDLKSLAFRSTNAMSGGEKQRVAIASILAMHPRVMIFDEPTGFLDRKSAINFFNVVKELNEKDRITIIIIDHQPFQMKEFLSRLIILENGSIKEEYKGNLIDYSRFITSREKMRQIQRLKPKISSERLLKIENLDVTLNTRLVLKKISLEINRGLIYGLIGPNGAGKTTLLETILNLNPSIGNIFYNNKNISKIPTFKLARDFGLIFQNPNHQIFENTVLKEIFFAPKNFNMELERVKEKAKSLIIENNLDKYTERSPFSLSFGEKRRLNICSIDIYDPSLLLLDEPFIGQDVKNINFLLDLLKRRKLEGKTTIIVSHRKELFDIVDYFILLDEGRIIEEGNSDEILN